MYENSYVAFDKLWTIWKARVSLKILPLDEEKWIRNNESLMTMMNNESLKLAILKTAKSATKKELFQSIPLFINPSILQKNMWVYKKWNWLE